MCCPSCDSFNIVHDYVHAEYYCGNCGLIVASYNTTQTHSIVEFKEKPISNEDKMDYILDILIFSLNINVF